MADYLITGKKGNGKGLFAVHMVLKYLKKGRRVAVNFDLFLHNHNPYWKFPPGQLMRLPDFVTAEDLMQLGRGQDGVVEDFNGAIFIDEASRNAGARSWNAEGREELLEWLIHSRKHGWDTWQIAQGSTQLDKVIRNTQIEYHVQISRTDKWRLPLVGWLGKLRPSGEPFTFPRMNIATIRQGFQQGAIVCDRIFYRGTEYYSLYSTQQIFLPRNHPDAKSLHAMPCPYDTHGKFLPPRLTLVELFKSKWHRFIEGRLGRPALPKPEKPLLVQRIEKLPPERRIEFYRRFQACGAI